MKTIDEVMFDERDGLNGRFRDGDYTVLPEEREVIDQYTDRVLREAHQNGSLGFEDFSRILKMIEIFEGTMDPNVLDLAYEIYMKVDQLILQARKKS